MKDIDVATTTCPNCGGKLSIGEIVKEEDETQATELICKKCRQRFVDIKLPYSAMELENEEN